MPKPRKPKSKAAAPESEWAAPFLTGLDSLPDRPELVDHVACYPDYKHNGKTLWSKDQTTCFEVLELRLLGWGKKRIARQCGVSPRSVQSIWDRAEERGILAPLKERLSKKAGEVIEDALDDIHDRVLAGSIPDNVLPVVMGIVADKKAQWDGGGLPVAPPAPVLNVEALNLFFGTPPEKASSVLAAIPASNQAPLSVGTSPGTSLLPANGPVVELEPAGVTRPGHRAEGGGGGPKFPPARAEADVSANTDQMAKGSWDGPEPV